MRRATNFNPTGGHLSPFHGHKGHLIFAVGDNADAREIPAPTSESSSCIAKESRSFRAVLHRPDLFPILKLGGSTRFFLLLMSACCSHSHYNECALSLGKENCDLQLNKLKACQVPLRVLPPCVHTLCVCTRTHNSSILCVCL